MSKASDKIWERVRYYNELSSEYSRMADNLTKLAQELDDDE